jgi:hypothetical protein
MTGHVEDVDTVTPVTRLHLLPAEVLLPDGAFHGSCLVRVTQAAVHVWAERAGRPELVYRSALTDPWDHVPRRVGVGVTLEVASAGGMVRVTRGRGCGCASPLRRFTPWTPDRRSS